VACSIASASRELGIVGNGLHVDVVVIVDRAVVVAVMLGVAFHQPGSELSIAPATSAASGSTWGPKRATTFPSGETRNFSKFQRISPV